MSCLINTGYSLGCRDSIGGISIAYIGNFEANQGYVFNGDNEITGLTGSGTVSYYKFEQEMETGSFNQEGAYSTENGTIFFNQSLSLTFHKNDADLRNTLLILSQANLSAIVKDQRGEYWLLGLKNGLRVTAGSMNTGKAFGDLNGVILTITGKEPEPAHRIDDITDFVIV
jgi:hypothetical protein